jgi:lipoprotein NlpD
MAGRMNRIGFFAFCLALAMALAACSSKPQTKAPVEDRSATATQPAGAADTKPLPGAENAGKPGYYTVKRGDTVMRIGLETGQAWRDIVRWNNLENPNLIEVGQVLRVVPPVAATAAASPATGAVSRPVASSSVAPAGATPPVGQARTSGQRRRGCAGCIRIDSRQRPRRRARTRWPSSGPARAW